MLVFIGNYLILEYDQMCDHMPWFESFLSFLSSFHVGQISHHQRKCWWSEWSGDLCLKHLRKNLREKLGLEYNHHPVSDTLQNHASLIFCCCFFKWTPGMEVLPSAQAPPPPPPPPPPLNHRPEGHIPWWMYCHCGILEWPEMNILNP